MKISRNHVAAALLAVALTLAGCETVQDAPAGDYKVGAAYEVTLTRQWSDISAIMKARPRNIHLLSVDGPLLNRLYLSEGLKDGDFLVKPEDETKPTPTYHAGMSITEEVEFVANSVAALSYERVETTNLRPSSFGGLDGVRFDITAETKEGLDISGTGLVADRGGRLFVIVYLAPSEHYYAEGLPEVESIMKSVRLGA